MATGMVLVIVTRHIDLSVGSMLGFIAIVMGTLQVNILPQYLGLGHPMIWVLAIFAGLIVGTLIGGFQGYMIAYGTIPAFIVTLGGLLVWRGVGFLVARGETIAPVDATFKLLGGGPYGAVGSTGSWIVGILGCAAVLALIILGRRKRKSFDLHLRPVWAEGFLAVVGCGAVIGATMLVNAYPWPKGIVKKYAEAEGIEVPSEGIFISHGYAIPVLILVGVAIVMTIIMSRTKFGRYVYAIGGNPEAAELAGINTRWMTVKIFGAIVMQSLQTGMVLIGFDAAIQQVVVGSVLVLAVFLDILYRRNSK